MWRDLTTDEQRKLQEEVRRLAIQTADLVTDNAGHAEPDSGLPEQRAAALLAVIRAVTAIHAAADNVLDQAVQEAGQSGLVGYPQIADAVGITRQSARQRWPHALPAGRRPGRRSTTPPPARPGALSLHQALEADEPPTVAAEPAPLLFTDAETIGQADATPAPVDQPPTAAKPRRAKRTAPAAAAAAPAEGVPWSSDSDPIKRRRWYTDDELSNVQVVKSGNIHGAYWVIVAGELLGTVEPHRTVRGGRSGWKARHRGGSEAWHLGKGAGGGSRPATRDKAVIDLISGVHHAWNNYRERRKRDAARRRLEER